MKLEHQDDEAENKYEAAHKTYKKKDIYINSIDTFSGSESKVPTILKKENSHRKQELIDKLKDIIDYLEN